MLMYFTINYIPNDGTFVKLGSETDLGPVFGFIYKKYHCINSEKEIYIEEIFGTGTGI